MLATCRRVARDANQRQLLESIERNALLRRAERPLGAPHMRSPPSRGPCASSIRTARPAWRAIGETAACSRSPLAASYTSMPRLGMLRVHSGRPLERAPRLARAHRAALARPSATQTPSQAPSGRLIARDLPPCGARRKPEAAGCSRRSSTTLHLSELSRTPYMRSPPLRGTLRLF